MGGIRASVMCLETALVWNVAILQGFTVNRMLLRISSAQTDDKTTVQFCIQNRSMTDMYSYSVNDRHIHMLGHRPTCPHTHFRSMTTCYVNGRHVHTFGQGPTDAQMRSPTDMLTYSVIDRHRIFGR
jgi:hypothetical protein